MSLGEIELNSKKYKFENQLLSNINTTYNNVTTNATSQVINCSQYRQVTLGFDLTKAGTPTDIIIILEISLNGTNYTQLTNGPLSKWIYDDVAVTGGTQRSYTFPIACQKIRVKVVATGTSAVNTFTMSNANLYLRD